MAGRATRQDELADSLIVCSSNTFATKGDFL